MKRVFDGKVAFAVGTGRCGTEFLARVVALEPGISSVHERNPLNEAFHRYGKWYNLPIDDEGFLYTKTLEIQRDLKNHHFSFEASAYLSLSIRELYARFGAKFILLVRSPERVVNSYLRKGWYDKPILRSNPQLALGYQETNPNLFYFFLGRIVPSEKEFVRWKRMSRVGKLAWYWNGLNASVLEQFAEMPKTDWRIERLEELSYHRYLEIAQFLGFESTVTPQAYQRLARSRPNAFTNIPTIATWDSNEIAEFESEVAPMAERLGYEYRIAHLPVPQVRQPSAIQRFIAVLRQMGRPVKRLVVRKLVYRYLK